MTGADVAVADGDFEAVYVTGDGSQVVTFPQVVALAEVLTDPDWRRHVATIPARQVGQFYRRVSIRLGEGTYQAPADDNPIIAWAQHHRSDFTDALRTATAKFA